MVSSMQFTMQSKADFMLRRRARFVVKFFDGVGLDAAYELFCPCLSVNTSAEAFPIQCFLLGPTYMEMEMEFLFAVHNGLLISAYVPHSSSKGVSGQNHMVLQM